VRRPTTRFDARPADLDDFAVLDQPAQQRLQLRAAFLLEAQRLDELAHGDGLAAFLQVPEHGIT
jgi:hypothetical protein